MKDNDTNQDLSDIVEKLMQENKQRQELIDNVAVR